MPNRSGTRTVAAVETGLDVLAYLLAHERAGVTEIADELGLTKATVHAHLQTLRDRRYVANEGGTYRLGLRLATAGRRAVHSHRLYSVARPKVDALAEKTGRSAQVGVEQHGLGYYLCRTRGAEATGVDIDIEAELPLHATAFGKVILANLPPEAVDDVVERHGLPELTERTITTRDELDEELRLIRDRGVAFDEGEHTEDVRCVAAPIRDEAEVVGAISVSGSSEQLYGDMLRVEIPGTVSEIAGSIESALPETG